MREEECGCVGAAHTVRSSGHGGLPHTGVQQGSILSISRSNSSDVFCFVCLVYVSSCPKYLKMSFLILRIILKMR